MEWNPMENEPEEEGFYLAYGPEVSGYFGGTYAVWRWDGDMWWDADGTETAFENQKAEAFWCELPAPPRS